MHRRTGALANARRATHIDRDQSEGWQVKIDADGIWAPRMLAVLRIVVALLFIEHGTQKLVGFPMPPGGQGPALVSLLGLAGVIELFGGLSILVGLFTRPVAFVLAGEMAVAYFIGHAPKSFFPALNGGDAAILFCFLYLYLCVAGPGAWSVDALRAEARPG
jgi:putative oxidoreductase